MYRCWQCGKSDHHVWECNRPAYEMKEVKEGDDMNRYLFYFERYFNHNESRKIAEKQRTATQTKIKEMVSQGILLHVTHNTPLLSLSLSGVNICLNLSINRYAFERC
jgi:hypothetical protein